MVEHRRQPGDGPPTLLAESDLMAARVRTIRTATGNVHLTTQRGKNMPRLLCGQPFDGQYDLLHPALLPTALAGGELCDNCRYLYNLSIELQR